MKKNILITLMLLSFVGCSEKEVTPKVSVKEAVENEPIKPVENEPIKPVAMDINKSIVIPITETVEFIPEHIKRSSIEVVKHY